MDLLYLIDGRRIPFISTGAKLARAQLHAGQTVFPLAQSSF